MSKSEHSPVVSLIAGGVAGGVEAFLTYPFEFAKTRAQLHEDTAAVSRNPFRVVAAVFRNEGARALYRGCSSLVVGSIAKDGVRFISFDSIKKAFADPETGTTSPLRNLLAGMTSGVVASIFAVTPTERLKTAMIDDARGSRRFHSTLHATRLIIQEHGLVGMYHGFTGTTLKQAGATAFRMGSYHILKDFETERQIKQSTLTNFANGAIAGTITTLATQPFDTIKTRSQTATGASTVDAFRSIVADHGLQGFWKGTTMRLGRTVFSGGILFTTYEQIASMLRPVLES